MNSGTVSKDCYFWRGGRMSHPFRYAGPLKHLALVSFIGRPCVLVLCDKEKNLPIHFLHTMHNLTHLQYVTPHLPFF